MLIPVISHWDCVGCEACVEVCPEVFEMRTDKAWVRSYEEFSCNECGILLSICPSRAIHFEEV